MAMSRTTAMEHARGMLDSGELPNLAAAHVAIVQMMGVMIVQTTVPRDVRTALSAGVKNGQIGRLPKNGLQPEAFFHINAKWNAMDERQRIANASIAALKTVFATSIQQHMPVG